MSNITGGHVRFTKRHKTGDFQHEDVEVQLSFGSETGDAAEILDNAADMAKDKVFQMLGIKARVVAHVAADVREAPAAKVEQLVKDALSGGEVPPARPPGRPPGTKKPAADAAVMVDEEVLKPDAIKLDPSVMDDSLFTAEGSPITDKELTDAITRKNAEIGSPPLIRVLIGEFVTPPKQAREIPMAARPAFLAKLEALKKPV